MDEQAYADAKARELLQRILPDDEWEKFNQTGTLEIGGARGTYRICAVDLTQVLDTQTLKPRLRTCLQLTVPAPPHDRIIAEYLLIRNDEDFYWKTANIFPASLDNRVFTAFFIAFDAALFILVLGQLLTI